MPRKRWEWNWDIEKPKKKTSIWDLVLTALAFIAFIYIFFPWLLSLILKKQ